VSNPVDQPEELINGYLDGMLTAEQEARLNDWVKADAVNASHFAAAVAFDTRLGEYCRSTAAVLDSSGLHLTKESVSVKRLNRRRLTFFGGLAATVMILTAAFWWQPAGRVNAATELDRLIAIEPDSTDRTYRITNLDPFPEQAEERRPPIDGAILHVRQPDQYLLQRQFSGGSLFLTGCDGRRSWALAPDGAPVRVSRDLQRFRGPLPGHQYGLPFVNLKSDLLQLREAYDLAVLQQDQGGLKGLVGFKKSHEYRGPRQVMLWYDGRTGVIRKMQFEGLPQARGGPNSVAVDLIEQGRKPADFYQHQSHHAEDVPVVEE